jgi:actin-related protein
MVRDVENKYLMLDNRTRKVALVVSPLLSHPLLEVALASLFNVLQCPSITVLPSSVMAAVGGGLRSALVIDIGWAETSVSAVLEYREVAQKRTVRASKMLNEEFSKAIAKGEDITFTEGEEVLTRMAWCREREGSGVTKIGGNEAALSISFSATSVQLTTNDLAAPADRVLFAQNTPNQELDDHELPIHLLAYNVLLSLPIDVRKLCMSRIVIAGGASNMPGLKRRVLQELEYLVQQRGWDPVRNYGSAGMRRKGDVLPKRAVNVQSSAVPGTIPVKVTEDTASPPPAAVDFAPAHLSPQEPDPVFAKLRQQQLKLDPIPVEGVVRAVNTLGAWAGASLAMNLRVRGVVEIERERFMQHGLVGGASKKEVSVAAQRQSLGPGVRPGGTERSSWNLGIWA